MRSEFQQSAYQLERANIMANEENGLMNDADNAVFRQLRNVVQEDNSRVQSPLRMQERPPSRQRMVNRVDSTDGRSSVAAWRGYTPTNEMRNQDWSSSAVNRTPTPSFPVKAETPLPYHPLLFNGATDNQSYSINYRSASPRSLYYGQSRRSSQSSMEPGEIITHHPVFVRDTSKYWYKPKITREEAINMLRDKEPGTFVVRDSNSFPGAFGLALKVATPPPGVTIGDGTELVRHFLIEPSSKGVKLKGCNNEPVFGTLSALVYQHSITALALPTKLLLPEYDPAITPEHVNAAQALLQQGAACNVTYIATLDTESLTGHTAVARCIGDALRLNEQRMIQPISVHFKVSAQGITITDNTRRLFFRRHYPVQSVSYAGLDPCDRRWDNSCMGGQSGGTYVKSARMFAFVARKIGSRTDNACHVFAELEPEQPATAVVNFITKVMLPQSRLAV
ncbi:hypothetical protein AB6A40_001852 [Gnathostoma spinigerum]|uniref:SH2 domain-containing protein n=1 Tax=Gnathostoma spinigerum TaxID=75299 RepID=A0ABD6E561_9BILA